MRIFELKSVLKAKIRLGCVRPRCVRNVWEGDTRAARARALFFKNVALHANTRAHALFSKL